MISGNFPGHLTAAARTGFLAGVRNPTATWRMVAEQVDINGASADFVDLGSSPMPKRSKRGVTIQGFAEKMLQVRPVDWDITIGISFNAVSDDYTGNLLRKARQAGGNFNRHMNKIVFQAINQGATIGEFGAAYDKKALFANDHIDEGAPYQVAQDNLNTLSLTPANFRTVYVDSSTRLDDTGEATGFVPNLLIVPPALDYDAAQITGNPQTPNSGAASSEVNPYSGKMSHIVTPDIDSTAWYLVDTTQDHKPLLLVMRQMPFLQDSWFDPEQPDGGIYYFKYFARYNVAYGDWRLITQGNT